MTAGLRVATAPVAFLAVALVSGLTTESFTAGPSFPAPLQSAGDPVTIENSSLSLTISGPDAIRLANKLSGKSYEISAAPFGLLLETGGRKAVVTAADFGPPTVSRPSAEILRLHYDGLGQWTGVGVKVEYRLTDAAWYVRKRLTVINGRKEPLIVHDATVDTFQIKNTPFPEKADNPVFLDGQLFWGMEWPIAEAAGRNGRIALTHFPGATIPPGGSWTSKTCGLGVSAAGRIEEAFGRYILDIRANRVDFATFYFDWLCHDNSGPLESEVLANFAALRRLKSLYGLQFDIYNSDAGLVESQGTYHPQFKSNFLGRFPSGLRPIADAAAALGMRLGLWIGPNGFGETPGEMAARSGLLRSWVEDFNVGLFKLDTVVSALSHPDKYILEKKYQSLADSLAEARTIDPEFIAINHRINNSPYMLTITDCLLWRGQETYIDVHITNRTASLYNRDCSIGRELTSEFFKTPFRLFEDCGICFNSCLEKWDDDLVTQAFGRASVLSPEMYGTFFFLPDGDYPRLARLIQLHKLSEPLLKAAFPLPDGDIAHGDGRSSLVLVRNMSWETRIKTIPLDSSIGLQASPAAPLTVRQRHPHELLISKEGSEYAFGETVTIEMDPFSTRMIQVDTGVPAEPHIAGIPYEIVPGPDGHSFGLKLLGKPGESYAVALINFDGLTARTDDGAVVPAGERPWRIRFPGRLPEEKLFSRKAEFEDDTDLARGAFLTESAKFAIDDDALEIREMDALKKNPSLLPEIEACRSYIWEKVVAAEGDDRNAFDGNPSTRWSDGYPKRSPFTGSPAPYRSDTSLWRIDLGSETDLTRLELHVVRRTEAAFLDAVETSLDLETWSRVDGLNLEAAGGIPLFSELRQRGKTIKIFDVEAGGNYPVTIEIPLSEARSRYVRIRGRNFSVTEIMGYDGQGRPLDRSRWRATNFLGETPLPRRVLKAADLVEEYRPGREYAVAVHAGPAKFDPVDGVYVAALVDGKPVVPRHRVPSYPYHNYEWNSGSPKLGGMTFRLPVDKSWTGKTVEFRVMLFGDGADGAEAILHVVTPDGIFSEKNLRVVKKGLVEPEKRIIQ
jgi:hypothetical protein